MRKNSWQRSIFFYFIVALFICNELVEARVPGVRFMSDPVELLLQDGFSSLKRRSLYNRDKPQRTRVIVRKRQYNPLPTFYSSNFGFAPISLHRRRTNSMPYMDLLFSG